MLSLVNSHEEEEAVFAISMINKTTYQALQAHPGRCGVKTVGESRAPITTAADVTILPDMTVDELEPATSAMLILPGADTWLEEPRAGVLSKANACLAAGVRSARRGHLRCCPGFSTVGHPE